MKSRRSSTARPRPSQSTREEPGLFETLEDRTPKRPDHAARSAQHAAIMEPVPGADPSSAISVATLTHVAKDVLEGAFMPLWVRGEVTDFKAHRSGHWYFGLRDGSAQIRCVVWSRDQRRIPAPPDDGMQVVALGQLTVYPARGDMQLSVRAMTADGDGLWRKALEITIASLGADGLLAPERKRPIPPHPSRVVVITSPDGAALHDIVAVIGRRCPMVEIVLVPARVQGDGAPEELCAAIERVSRWGEADTLIIGRGGGARDDLRAFNDERVARALARCPIPTISAVGHEIDVTVCDLVADLRAPTPSAAAEAAVPAIEVLHRELRHAGALLAQAMHDRLAGGRRRLAAAHRDATASARLAAERKRTRLQRLAGSLEALSPLSVLSRGYAVAQDERGRTLASAAAFEPGRTFRLIVRDGAVEANTVAVSSNETAPAAPRAPRASRKETR